ncbi:alpha-glucan family phosphorylase [Paenibacillus tarimensis]
MKLNHNSGLMGKIPKELELLVELSYNMWFSWNENATRLFREIDSQSWEQAGHNPVKMLMEMNDRILYEKAQDEQFLKLYRKVSKEWEDYQRQITWFDRNFPEHTDKQIAYFSAEFGFHESLPIYSGGLGVLAGDHTKSASDLGLPFIGVGLLYKKGYFQQKIDSQGRQHADLHQYEFNKLPIREVLVGGEELIVPVELPGRQAHLKVWGVAVGRVHVLLLDADIAPNSEWDRDLTAQLYGGNQETRISQELMLGIGGIRALRALNIHPQVYHMNEGHSAFISMERLREMAAAGLPFPASVEAIRSNTIFTTHTPVPAGHDVFPIELMDRYFGVMYGSLGTSRDDILALGQLSDKTNFNMTFLAMNTSGFHNGVSKLHGKISRQMFQSFFGGLPVHEVPVDYVTNGVHLETWMAPEMKLLLDEYLTKSWRNASAQEWQNIGLIPNEKFWNVRKLLKEKLIALARKNLIEQKLRNGAGDAAVEAVNNYLDPRALTIGFARRFATYKRANLLFQDIDRMKRILSDPKRPVQLIFAGKAHPADYPGQELIREIYRITQMPEFAGKVVLLENYDMNMARYLVQGVDVWLNNPRRPMEASGTSGQKAALNGGINFSVLDGWWEEGYTDRNGWAITSQYDADWKAQEKQEVESLYKVLENEIIPLYYSSDNRDLHDRWITKAKTSMIMLSPVYNTSRMVMDYTMKFYTPAMARAERFKQNRYELAVRVADFKAFLRIHWHQVKIMSLWDWTGESAAEINDSGERIKQIKVIVKYGTVWYKDSVVEALYFSEQDGDWSPVKVPLRHVYDHGEGIHEFAGWIPVHLKHQDHYSVRVRPVSGDFAHPFELPLMTSSR